MTGQPQCDEPVTEEMREAFTWAVKTGSPTGSRIVAQMRRRDKILPRAWVVDAVAEWKAAGSPPTRFERSNAHTPKRH
jgi:hypothetical protein